MLENLPLECLMQICANLDLKDVVCVSEVNKNLARVARADSVWLNQFQIHFPDVLTKLKKRNIPVAKNTWYDEFVAAYNKEYEGIENNVKKAFSRVNENKENSFDDLHLTSLDLLSQQANGLSLIDVARNKNNQAALDCFYQIHEAYFNKFSLLIPITAPVHYRQSDKIKALISQQISPPIQALIELVLDGDIENFTLLSVHLQENHSQNNPNFMKDVINTNGLLTCAVAGGHLKMVSCLLNMGANVEQTLRYKNFDFLSRFFPHVYKKIRYNTPLSLAAQYGCIDIVQCLLDANAKVDNPKGYGSPIFAAASHGHVEIVQLLIAKDRSLLEQKGLSEHTPLMDAAKEGHADVVSALIKLGANIRTQSNDNRCQAIHLAAMNGHLNVIEHLVTHDKELINEKNTLGETPLVYADLYRQDQIVNYLRKRLPPPPKEVGAMITKLQALKDRKPLKEWYYNQLSHYKILSSDKLAWINQPDVIVAFASALAPEEFKAFFYGVVRCNICSINAVTNALTTHPSEEKIFKENQAFIKNFILPFASHRKIIEDSIKALERKDKEIRSIGDKLSLDRSIIIFVFASSLRRKSDDFFTNPNPENAQHFFDECQKLLTTSQMDRRQTDSVSFNLINCPRTSEISRIINTILLVIAHIFIVTIPIIWLHPASRNLLLGKTESQAKLEDAVDKVRQFNQLMQQGKFNSLFHPPQPTLAATEATHACLSPEKTL